MSVMTDPHEVLGVRRGASPQEIKVAYRRLAMQTHPDVSTRLDAEQFKQVSEAYERLGNSSQDAPSSCGEQCGNPSCSNWRPANASDWVWNDRMLPELFATLVDETGGSDELTQLYRRYTMGEVPRKEMLLSIRSLASREQFRNALVRLAGRHGEEGGEQRAMAGERGSTS